MSETVASAKPIGSVGARRPAVEASGNKNPLPQVTEILKGALLPPESPALESEPEVPAVEAEPEVTPEPIAEAETPQEKVKSLKALAEAAGIDMRDLYALEVGLGNGEEPITLGQMKDRAKAALDLDARESEVSVKQQEFENYVLRTQAELREAFNLAKLTPEMLERGRALHSQTLEREQAALWSAVPALSDPDFRKQTHIDVTELAASYGISGNEVNNLADHRVYKMAMDLAALRKRIAAANPGAKKTMKGTQVGSGNAPKTSGGDAGLIETAKRTGLVHDQVRAVASILGNIK